MSVLQIKLNSEVTFDELLVGHIGYKYDVFFDTLEIPCIPIGRILSMYDGFPDYIKAGVAHPDGYFGMINNLNTLLSNFPGVRPTVHEYFTNDRFIEDKGYRIRSLKKGLKFFAIITFPFDKKDEVDAILKKIKKIGVSHDNISREVELSLIDENKFFKSQALASELCTYSSLDYSIMVITPTCIYADYSQGIQTYNYFPGAVIKKAILTHPDCNIDMDNNDMIFSNAYINNGKERLIPTPICMAAIKLDKQQLRYRLSPGKNPNIAEQDVTLSNTYCENILRNHIAYISPEISKTNTKQGRVIETIVEGQIFSGKIYGPDNKLRSVADFFEKNPLLIVGDMTRFGLGEVYIKVDRLNEENLETEVFLRYFDVLCLSDIILLNDDGMTTCTAESLLEEIEYKLGLSNRLKIVGKYTEIKNDYNKDIIWEQNRDVTRCIAKGSVLRLQAKDNMPIDVSKLYGCFIGERNAEGYGEITVYPAVDKYYRITDEISPPKYKLDTQLNIHATQMGSHVLQGIINEVLKRHVMDLAKTDRHKYLEGTPLKNIIKLDVLKNLQQMYNPLVDIDTIIGWYKKGLEMDYDI